MTAGHRALEKVQVTGGDETDEKHVVVVDSRDFDVFVGVKEPCELFAMVNVDDGIRRSVRNEKRARHPPGEVTRHEPVLQHAADG